MTLETRQQHEPAARWLLNQPVPVRKALLEGWQRSVRSHFDPADIPTLLDLLVGDDAELSYQSMAALRALGAVVWVDEADDRLWDVRLPNGSVLQRGPAARP